MFRRCSAASAADRSDRDVPAGLEARYVGSAGSRGQLFRCAPSGATPRRGAPRVYARIAASALIGAATRVAASAHVLASAHTRPYRARLCTPPDSAHTVSRVDDEAQLHLSCQKSSRSGCQDATAASADIAVEELAPRRGLTAGGAARSGRGPEYEQQHSGIEDIIARRVTRSGPASAPGRRQRRRRVYVPAAELSPLALLCP